MALHRRDMLSAAASIATAAVLAPHAAAAQGRRILHGGNDPLGVRPDFPVLGNGRAYLNAAYIAPTPRSVLDAGVSFLHAKAERPLTVGELLGRAGAVRAQFAKLVNATPEEIGFVFATTEGENIVANTAPMLPGDNVVVDNLHYEGALVVYRQLERRRGIELRIVEHRDGHVTPEDFARRVDARTRVISVSYVSSINGLRHDVRALADLAHTHGALLHVDAIQAVGTLAVDVRADDVDFLCCGTYKFLLGGFGIAPFYVRRSLLDRVAPDRFGIFQVEAAMSGYQFRLRNTARRHEYATLPFAEVHQLGAALEYLDKVGVTRIQDHVLGLTRRLERGLLEQGFKLFTPPGNQAPVLCFHTTRPTADVRRAFEAEQVDVTVREGHVRVSMALYNNSDDVERVLAAGRRLL
jgi:selenocysteine lyase/cysteine desulfurase